MVAIGTIGAGVVGVAVGAGGTPVGAAVDVGSGGIEVAVEVGAAAAGVEVGSSVVHAAASSITAARPRMIP